MGTIRFRTFLPFLLIGFCSVVSWTQTGSISGNITDTSGALVGGAEVTVRNLETNLLRTTLSSNTGHYSVTELPVGTYEIRVKEANFKTFRATGIALTVAQTLTLNAALQVGSVNEAVEVTAGGAADVDLETAQVSNLVDQKQMQDLPLITRDP